MFDCLRSAIVWTNGTACDEICGSFKVLGMDVGDNEVESTFVVLTTHSDRCVQLSSIAHDRLGPDGGMNAIRILLGRRAIGNHGSSIGYTEQ